MRHRVAEFFQDRRVYRRALRLHRHAENVAGANGVRKETSAAPALAPTLEHESEQRELSRATRRGSVVFAGRPQTSARACRSLYGQCENFTRSRDESRIASVWRNEC